MTPLKKTSVNIKRMQKLWAAKNNYLDQEKSYYNLYYRGNFENGLKKGLGTEIWNGTHKF